VKIACVTRHSYPTDQEIRVTKFARTLSSRGHEFYVFCPGRGTQAPFEFFMHGRIIRLKPWVEGRLGGLLVAPLPVNLVWAWWLLRRFRENSIDLVIVRDLRLALPVFLAARLCGIASILDLGEHYPGMMEIIGKERLAHHIIRSHRLITWLEAVSVRMASVVWVVVDENRERLKSYSSRIEVISNYPVNEDTVRQKVPVRPFRRNGNPINLVSLGLIDAIRGLDMAVDSLSILAEALGNVRLLIYGDGPFRSTLESRVKALGLTDRVVFAGWVPGSMRFEVLRRGDIGLILHKVCDLTRHTVPNKLFDYMSVGLPVVSTQLGPISRILESERCGIVVDESPEGAAEGIGELILDWEKRALFSENGYRAAQFRYRWAYEEGKIVRDISSLTGKAC
jgi:glycosyltransferase involved in cell wall biosynthesis